MKQIKNKIFKKSSWQWDKFYDNIIIVHEGNRVEGQWDKKYKKANNCERQEKEVNYLGIT